MNRRTMIIALSDLERLQKDRALRYSQGEETLSPANLDEAALLERLREESLRFASDLRAQCRKLADPEEAFPKGPVYLEWEHANQGLREVNGPLLLSYARLENAAMDVYDGIIRQLGEDSEVRQFLQNQHHNLQETRDLLAAYYQSTRTAGSQAST